MNHTGCYLLRFLHLKHLAVFLFYRFLFRKVLHLFSLHIHSMWETTVMHKQVSDWTVNFGPNFPEYPFLELKTRIPPPSENFRFGMTKVYSGIPPHFGKLQIWDDQSLLQNTPPISENFRFGMTKVYSGIPPPISENFRFGMTKVYSRIPPHFGKLQIWDHQSLLRNTPPNENCQRVQVRDFQNTESYYM